LPRDWSNAEILYLRHTGFFITTGGAIVPESCNYLLGYQTEIDYGSSLYFVLLHKIQTRCNQFQGNCSRLFYSKGFLLDLYRFVPVILIDTHNHLFLPEFKDDRSRVISDAREKGIGKILLPNVDDKTMDSMLSLADEYPGYCLPMMGLHPTSVDESYPEKLALVRKMLASRKFWGIGETGIDLYWDHTYIRQQKIAFTQQIELAKEFDLPIVIHARNAFREIFEILDKENDDSLRGVFHAFTGDARQAEKIIDYGFKIGIGGIVTFKNAGLDRTAREIPLPHMVLETDAPYLAPVPHRGRRNEPAYLEYTAEKLSEIHEQPLEVIAEVTSRNAAELFNIKI
jgi:TatD DNase family protein